MAYDLIRGKVTRDWSIGSLLLPAKQQKALFAKIDDVFALSGALGLLALASIFRTATSAPELPKEKKPNLPSDRVVWSKR